jgi:rhodanese-related sulfurtransferase
MTSEECKKLVAGTEPLLLVDVRESDEVEEEPFFRTEHQAYVNIPLTLIAFLPKEELCERLESVAGRFGKPLSELRIIAACRSGNRSRLAVDRFALAGIVAENLDGGRIAWGEAM